MAFSWRRIRRHLGTRSNRPRDDRENWATLGHHAEAPQFRAAPAPLRVCPHDWNTLHGAAALGYGRIVRRLLEQGAPIDEQDEYGRTPLLWTVEDSRSALAELLLARGADPDLRDMNGLGPLHVAARRGSLELLRLLLRNGATPDAGADDAGTALMEAVRRGDDKAIDLLLAAGAQPDARDRFGHTAVFFVQSATAARTLPLLLDAGASRLARTHDGDTVLHRALRQGDLRLWKALAPAEDEAALAQENGRAGETTLIAAAEGGNPALLKRLLAQGVPVDATGRFGHSALLVALTAENLPAAAVLTGAGAQVGFLEAIALGDLDRARTLPRPTAAALDAPIVGQETPLMGAVARGRADLATLLLDIGASPDAGSAPIGTPLDVAALTGQEALVALLLERGADPSRARKVAPAELRRMARASRGATGWDEATPASVGATRPDTDAVYAAAVTGDDGALTFLRLCGGDVDAQDEAGQTALLRAARDGDEPAVRRLLAFGASRTHRDEAGETALDLARRYRREAVVRLLEA